MSPTASYVIPSEYGTNNLGSGTVNNEEPISRTYQYRKVMKPMLERKRRARINRCLDELKELMVTALHSEGENVSKLEKADILELTVRHLHTLKQQHQLVLGNNNSSEEGSGSGSGGAGYADRFRAGFNHCAQEVSQFLTATAPPAELMEPVAGKRLLQHLGACVQHLDRGLQQQQLEQQQQHEPQQYPLPATNYAPISPTIRAQQDKQRPMWRPW